MFRFALTAAAITLAGFVSANEYTIGDAANGESLFKQSQSECKKCECTDTLVAQDQTVTSIEKLDEQVRLCDSEINMNWYESDIHDVVAYLNETYYKFPTQQE